MRVSFACPSCNAPGSIDAVHIGKQVRCKQCGAQFAIPNPDEPEPYVYALEELPEPTVNDKPGSLAEDAVFVPSRVDKSSYAERPKRQRRRTSETITRTVRRRKPDFPWQTWLIRVGIAYTVILTAIALIAPDGTWLAGCILLVTGMLLVLVGWSAGAYGAFREDFLYGFLYVVIPVYTAFYIVTRWEDLWVWFTGSTVGVGLVLLGWAMLRWAGVDF